MDVCAYWFWLVNVFGPANRRLWRFAKAFDTVDRFYDSVKNGKINGLTDSERKAAEQFDIMDAAEIVDEYRSSGIKVYCYESEGYPDKLREISNPPAVIFVRGSLDFLDNNIVLDAAGAREPSAYSSGIAETVCRKLAERGCIIASGLSNGIDSIAVNAALKRGFPTLGVCGLSIDMYEDDEFVAEIVKNGAVISEYCERYDHFKPDFSDRNRLLVGLCDAVMFFEGASNSKGLKLCEQAIMGGRLLFVVPPHDITDDRYTGQSWLIRRGCRCLLSENDVLFCMAHLSVDELKYDSIDGIFSLPEDYSFFRDESPESKERSVRKRISRKEQRSESADADDPKEKELDYSELDDDEKRICELLKTDVQLVDAIAASLDMDISDVLAKLTMLELNGFIRSLPGKRYSLI